ncbi:hypothetical protein BD324DRAFT_654170 [Kockovaella imperatae]|uniref:Uncharacterized protein n=1 Tax=Kockovaella imperatae TaxID=4999 RepID=A0A1Y1U600_9TREE|nr:hypothetical protein BD324DRAFT_654170 [Kockovaella imperatae]ORX33460.1 hypothetical protein BD324DRAFT_654170 [Kockovaella imperatae]
MPDTTQDTANWTNPSCDCPAHRIYGQSDVPRFTEPLALSSRFDYSNGKSKRYCFPTCARMAFHTALHTWAARESTPFTIPQCSFAHPKVQELYECSPEAIEKAVPGYWQDALLLESVETNTNEGFINGAKGSILPLDKTVSVEESLRRWKDFETDQGTLSSVGCNETNKAMLHV